MGVLIVYLITVITVSFGCSLMESVILSVNDTFIRQLRDKKSKAGQILFTLKKDIDRPLAAILTLNTVANTLGSAGVGAQVLKIYGDTYVALASGILTFVILVFSEIIPKTLGALYWRKLAPVLAPIIAMLIKILYPFVYLAEHMGDWIAKGQERGPVFTREELITTADIGLEEGVLLKKEGIIIRNLLRLHNVFVKDIMTPRSVVVALPENLNIDQAIEKYSPLPFSRIPVYGNDLNDIKGLVLRYEMLEIYGDDQGANESLAKITHPVMKVSEDSSVSQALDLFIKHQEHIFIATDKTGATVGIVTLEDTIETLLGVEIVDEFDSVEDMRKFAHEQWKKRVHSRHTSRVVRSLLYEMAQEGQKDGDK
ncbi:MAG: HlyC/CorC family transporter [Bdellovibrionales bacterium]|nr:HlyC/CorC family transporter [Bdellovibrionales bacterium]